MQTYSEFAPTQFDVSGAFLPDRQDWLVAPVSRTRDSEPLEESNFAVALELLGDNVEVHCFNHWACGWFEIIIIRPDTPEIIIAEGIESKLEDYPILDEDDLSMRELEL